MENELKKEPVIYVGPNIFLFAVHKFQVYADGLPPYVTRAIEKIPEIESLIVPVSELEAMRAKIEEAGTKESRLYNKIEKAVEKLIKESRVKK